MLSRSRCSIAPGRGYVAALHTGITGAMLNVRIYQALLDALAARP